MAKTSGRTTQGRAAKQRKLRLNKDTLKDLEPKQGNAVKGAMAGQFVPTRYCATTNPCWP